MAVGRIDLLILGSLHTGPKHGYGIPLPHTPAFRPGVEGRGRFAGSVR